MTEKIVIDLTVSELHRAAKMILLPDELTAIEAGLNRIERNRMICEIARHLRQTMGLSGEDLAHATLNIAKASETLFTEKVTFSIVHHALHRTDYGLREKQVKRNTLKNRNGEID